MKYHAEGIRETEKGEKMKYKLERRNLNENEGWYHRSYITAENGNI